MLEGRDAWSPLEVPLRFMPLAGSLDPGAGSEDRRDVVPGWRLDLSVALGLALGLILGSGAVPEAGAATTEKAGADLGQAVGTTDGLSGEVLAQRICSGCHQFPAPDLLDRRTWEEQILPRMETRLGVTPPDYSSSPEGELLRSLEIYPKEPLIPRADWEAIVAYYLGAAPEKPLPQGSRPEIRVGLPLFRFEAPRFRYSPPLTTLVRISSLSHRIYLGDDQARSIAVLDAGGNLTGSLWVDNIPVDVDEAAEGIYVTCVGSVPPSEIQRAALMFFPWATQGFGERLVLADRLPRAAQAEMADLDGDGWPDVVMCLYGNHRGRFSWFRRGPGMTHREEVLVEKSGAIHCLARDFDGDGNIDLGLLMAQENETLQILFNDGRGEFRGEYVFQRPPVYGHNQFEVHDFDGDGIDDLLVTNGDNGEFTSPPKRYHGIRIHRGRGGGRFEEEPAYFFPLNGATKTVARDFDGDGDLDLAAISFFPDYERSPRESFVYLERRGPWEFAPATFAQCITGRWLTMDAGDVDGDGDIDLVLGSYVRGPTAVPAFLAQTWEKGGPSVVILRNQTR